MRVQKYINNLIFVMNDGSKSQDCGSDVGTLSTDFYQGCNLAFFRGHSGAILDSIQFIWIC